MVIDMITFNNNNTGRDLAENNNFFDHDYLKNVAKINRYGDRLIIIEVYKLIAS